MSEWLSGIGPAVGNHLWQSTAFAAAVWVATLLLRKNQAWVRYGLWLAASVKFLIPFSLLVALGGMLPRPQRVVAAPAVYSAVDGMAQPFAEGEYTAVAGTHISEARHGAPELVAGVWLCGLGVVLVVWGVRWRQVYATLRRAVRVDAGREVEILRRVEGAMGGSGRIPLLISRELMEPGIFGIFRPVLIWPEQLSARLNDEHIEAILAHEGMHARRRDNLTAALHMVVEAVFWFHPLVWWMERRMVEERERVCDEAVVAMGRRPEAYAESLLRACRFCVESPLTCVAGITGADLSKRVRAIMTLRLEKMSLGRKLALALFGVLAVAAPMMFGLVRMIPLGAQILHASGPLPSFEVATIKPSRGFSFPPPPLPGTGGAPPPPLRAGPLPEVGVISLTEPVREFIGAAYNVPISFLKSEVLGGPAWIDTDMYQFRGKVEAGMKVAMDKMSHEQRDQQMELMSQSLLADRLKLKVHFETRELPVYALVVAKGGPKLTAAASLPQSTVNPPLSSPGIEASFKKGMLFIPEGQETKVIARSVTLDEVVHEALIAKNPALGGRVVVNRTGLGGTYDFTLVFGPDRMATAESSEVEEPPLLIAIQEQLGLKLVPTKGPVEVIVIDHIERPSAN